MKDIDGLTFWPFSRRSAWMATALLVPILIVLAAILQSAGVLAGDGLSPQIVLIVVVLGALPVLALVLERVTSVKAPGGVEIAFAAVQATVRTAEATARTTISENLGTPPGTAIQDSSGGSILQAVRAGTASDVVVVDLGDGHRWWQSRLLLLVSGMARHRPNSAIVFTAVLAEQPQQFIGWTHSTAVRDCLLAADDALRRAYKVANQETNLAALASPVQVITQGTALDTPFQLAIGRSMPDVTKLDAFVGEQLLFQQLLGVEGGHLGRGVEVTASQARDLFAPVLHVHSLAEEESASEKLSALVKSNDDYLAITDKGRYVNLVPHRVVVSAVLSSLALGEGAG